MSVAGKIGELQVRRPWAPKAKMIQDLYILEVRSNKEYIIKIVVARVAEERREEASYVKQEEDTKRFLMAEFPG